MAVTERFVHQTHAFSTSVNKLNNNVVFKLSPCSKCNLFLFGQFPCVWVLIADVSELTVGSIFISRWMKYVSGWIVWGIYTWLGWSEEVAEPRRKECARTGTLLPRAHSFLLALPLPRFNSIRYKYPTQSIHWHTSFTCLWRWNRQWVPKRRQLELRRRGITQKGTDYKFNNKFYKNPPSPPNKTLKSLTLCHRRRGGYMDVLCQPKKRLWSDVSQMLSDQGVDPTSLLGRCEGVVLSMQCNFHTKVTCIGPCIVLVNEE